MVGQLGNYFVFFFFCGPIVFGDAGCVDPLNHQKSKVARLFPIRSPHNTLAFAKLVCGPSKWFAELCEITMINHDITMINYLPQFFRGYFMVDVMVDVMPWYIRAW